MGVSFFSCEDYIEKGIEGQWQMTKVIETDGSEHAVDTIYYGFKKGVFKYMRMKTEFTSFDYYGQYTERDGKLKLVLSDPWSNCEECNGDDLYWGIGQYERIYNVQKRTSSTLELEFNGELYIFRKY